MKASSSMTAETRNVGAEVAALMSAFEELLPGERVAIWAPNGAACA